jgi:hypothetical protein
VVDERNQPKQGAAEDKPGVVPLALRVPFIAKGAARAAWVWARRLSVEWRKARFKLARARSGPDKGARGGAGARGAARSIAARGTAGGKDGWVGGDCMSGVSKTQRVGNGRAFGALGSLNRPHERSDWAHCG